MANRACSAVVADLPCSSTAWVLKSRTSTPKISSIKASPGLLQNELGIGHVREELSHAEGKVDILLLCRVRGGAGQQLGEHVDLLAQQCDIRQMRAGVK